MTRIRGLGEAIPPSVESQNAWTTGPVGAFVLFVCATITGVASVFFTRPTAIFCALLFVASLTWHAPRSLIRVSLAMLFVAPLLLVVPQLRPDQVNYEAMYGLFVIPVAVVTCTRARRMVFDSGALLLSALLASAVVTLLVGGALATDYAYLVWPLTTLAVYLFVLNGPENTHRWLLTLIVLFSLLEATIGISQSALGWPVLTAALPALAETDRGVLGYLLPGFSSTVASGSGTFWHFNILGSLLALSMPISFGWLLERRRSLWRVITFAVLAGGLLTTYSRGAWVGAAVGCILVYWHSRSKTSRHWLPFLCAGALIVVAFSAPYIGSYYEATQNVTSRLSTWRYAFAYWVADIQQIPFGTGFGSFRQSVLLENYLQGGGTLPSLHSGLLQILLEMGLVGMILFAWFLVTTFRVSGGPRGSRWQAWALGGILGLLVSQLFDNALFYMTGTCAFALAACLRRPDSRKDPDRR